MGVVSVFFLNALEVHQHLVDVRNMHLIKIEGREFNSAESECYSLVRSAGIRKYFY